MASQSPDSRARGEDPIPPPIARDPSEESNSPPQADDSPTNAVEANGKFIADTDNLVSAAPSRDEIAEPSLEEIAEPSLDDFEAIVDRYQLLVFSYLRARVLQESDAEDLTQEVFLRFYSARDRFDEGRAIRPYLLGIARNLLRERARTLKHRNEVSWTALCLEVEAAEPEPADFPEELMDRLPGCIAKLGPAARLAVELHYGARLKLQEIARRMQRSEGAVKVLLFRARQALKRCLAEEEGGQRPNRPR